MYVLIFLLESTANKEHTDLKKVKIWIEQFIDLYNFFLALSSNFSHIPKYIDDRTVATHLEMTNSIKL